MNFLSFFIVFLGLASCSELFGESCEPVTGIYDLIEGDLTVERIRDVKANKHQKLVYGMLVKPPLDVISYAIENKVVDVNAFDCYDRCALSYAIDNSDFDAAELLVQLGADVNRYTHHTILVLTAFSGNLEGVNFLLGHGAIFNSTGASGYTPLMAAADSGNFEFFMFIAGLTDPQDINARNRHGETALAMAKYRGNPEIIKHLIDLGATE